jgi:hypothetical protein
MVLTCFCEILKQRIHIFSYDYTIQTLHSPVSPLKMASTPEYVALTLGTHTWNPEDEKVDKIVELMRKYGVKNMDTARAYVGSPIL